MEVSRAVRNGEMVVMPDKDNSLSIEDSLRAPGLRTRLSKSLGYKAIANHSRADAVRSDE